MKFMAKIEGDTLRGQDTNMLSFPSTFGMSTIFTVENRNYCRVLPGQVGRTKPILCPSI